MRSAAATPTIIFVVVVFMSARKRELPPQKLSRSEEHTSELQSQSNLVCRLLLEKKNVVHRHGDLGQDRAAGQLLDGQALLAERLDQLLPPGLDGVVAPFPGEPLPDLRPGPVRLD